MQNLKNLRLAEKGFSLAKMLLNVLLFSCRLETTYLINL